MTGLLLLPAILSLLVLGAHFFRSGMLPLVVAILMLIALLAVRRVWAMRVVQIALVLGAAEWIRTLAELATERADSGEPYVRLCLILGGVALFTGLSALMFNTERLRVRYRTP